MNKSKFTADAITGKMERRIMPNHFNGNNNDGSEDMLECLFRKQNELHQTITTHSSSDDSQYSKKFLSLSKEERLSALCTAIIHEAVELQRLTNWKWWKKRVDFVIDASIELEMTPYDILTAYTTKNQINKDRQKNGY
jgi:dimeric dUTPase (all-alpha-NTP-PPase superfamily)